MTNWLWTKDEDRIVLEMAERGETTVAIAHVLGRTKHAVSTRRRIINGKRLPRRGQVKAAAAIPERITTLAATIGRTTNRRLLRQYRGGLLRLLAERHGVVVECRAIVAPGVTGDVSGGVS